MDTKDGVTVARCKFGRSSHGHAVIKVEGVLAADPSTVYQFMQISTREGGKVSEGLQEINLKCFFKIDNILRSFFGYGDSECLEVNF